MEKALKDAFILGCADGAVHTRLPEIDWNIITYSFTIVSRYLMLDCGIYPSSSKWIISHVQMRAKENRHTLKSVLQFRLRDYDAVAREKNSRMFQNLPFYDIADGKALYLYLEHCHWSSHIKPFLFVAASAEKTTDMCVRYFLFRN